MYKRLILMSMLMLNSCSGTTSYLGNPNVMLETITIVGKAGMNGNSATPLDLVIVYDANLLKQIAAMTASDYFANKANIIKDNPNLIQVVPFEVVPIQTLPDIPISLTHPNGEGAILFANYSTPGDHRIKVGMQLHLLITLDTNDMTIDPPN